MKYCIHLTVVLLVAFGVASAGHARGVYEDPKVFIQQAFNGDPPEPRKLWITRDLKKSIRTILDHDLNALRIRYWGEAGRTAWILEEIGKDQPITTGIVVNNGRIELLRVLIFRESRGGEVRYPFFTDQFKGLSRSANNKLSKGIDGISGATLSVRALSKLARLALLLHDHSAFKSN